MLKFRIRDFVSRDQFFHIARVPVPARRPVPPHAHDFAEMFWIEQGRGVHLINGKRLPLEHGDLVLIRPPDCHAFAARDGASFTMVNVAFRADVVEFLRRRYFGRREFPWTGDALPSQFTVGPAELSRLREWSDELSTRAQSRLELECFLMSVLRMVSTHRDALPGADRPAWLDRAMATFAAPEHFSIGPAELARLADRCPEHLNRVVRKCFGKTTTDLVNDIRLDYAARQLRMTNRSILDLSLDCGITNLGYFYRLFRKRFERTPRQYRLEKRAVVR